MAHWSVIITYTQRGCGDLHAEEAAILLSLFEDFSGEAVQIFEGGSKCLCVCVYSLGSHACWAVCMITTRVIVEH